MLTKADLESEFYDNFNCVIPSEKELEFLTFLLRYHILRTEKHKLPKSFEPIMLPEFPWTEHLSNYKQASIFALVKLYRKLQRLPGKCIIIKEPWYFGYRADLGVVLPKEEDCYDTILAVEVGGTYISKIVDCLLNLRLLQAIWHFPDEVEYFIWTRDKNAEAYCSAGGIINAIKNPS